MVVESVITGLTASEAVVILLLAWFNMNRETHRFVDVLKSQFGYDVSSQQNGKGSRQSNKKPADSHVNVGSMKSLENAGNKDLKDLEDSGISPAAPATTVETTIANELKSSDSAAATIPKLDSDVEPYLRNKSRSLEIRITAGSSAELGVGSLNSSRRMAPIQSPRSQKNKKLVTNTAVYTAYQTRVVLVACILSLVAAIDPLGKVDLLGFEVFISLTYVQVFLGYIVICFWCYSWVSFLLDFHQAPFQSKNVIKVVFFILLVINFIATILLISYFCTASYGIPFVLSWYSLAAVWMISCVIFCIVCTQAASKTIRFLQGSTFSSKHSESIVNLKRKMVFANATFFSAFAIASVPVLFNLPIAVGINKAQPPKWFFYSLMLLLPQGWGCILAFNWIWKIEVSSTDLVLGSPRNKSSSAAV